MTNENGQGRTRTDKDGQGWTGADKKNQKGGNGDDGQGKEVPVQKMPGDVGDGKLQRSAGADNGHMGQGNTAGNVQGGLSAMPKHGGVCESQRIGGEQ